MNGAKVKILFLGSRRLAEHILVFILENKDLCEVVGIVLPKFEGWWDDALETVVKGNNIHQYDKIEDTIHLEYDLILSVNYWKLIPLNFIKKVNGNALNIHHSYRLKFKGRYSTSWAIMHARKDNCWEHGTTIHYIDEMLDGGRILATDKVDITEIDTAQTLFDRVEELALVLFKGAFQEILTGSQKSLAQSEITFSYDRFSKDTITLPDPVSHIDLYDFIRAWTFKGRPLPSLLMGNGQRIIFELQDNN